MEKIKVDNPFGKSDNLGKKPNLKPKAPEPVEEQEPIVEPGEETPVQSGDLLAGLEEKKPKTKSYSVYLDVDVVAEVDKIAKRMKTNRSKVLNTLLRNYLIK